MNRKAYPSDVSDDEWAFVAPYLTLMTEDAPQRTYPLRYDDVTSNQLQAEIASLSKEEHDLYLKLSDAIQRVGAGEDTAYLPAEFVTLRDALLCVMDKEGVSSFIDIDLSDDEIKQALWGCGYSPPQPTSPPPW